MSLESIPVFDQLVDRGCCHVVTSGRATAQEERGDGYKLKDKNNRPVLCYRCHQAASFTQQRRILSCDFCEQHWHLDCLDPPMTGMPPAGRKWMCPLHADPLLVSLCVVLVHALELTCATAAPEASQQADYDGHGQGSHGAQ